MTQPTNRAVEPPGCDFCSKEIPAFKEYECNDFTIGILVGDDDKPTQVQNTIGNWFACVECAYLIDNDKQEELANRAIRVITKAQGYDFNALPERVRRGIAASVLACHVGFFNNRREKAT
jgi:hypothetical protein